ncbi:MAG: ArsC family transcriptional regulator [Chrysiogenales bacterium]|nr:MAG: ArsC family transcriptional regulator [Chrysiogenales bacterium]
MIQIIGTKKCKDTQKAIRFFKERRVSFQFLDVGERNLSPGELKNITRSIPVDELIDREGREFARKNLHWMKFDPAVALLENSLLLKTPVVRSGGRAVLGLRIEEWKKLADGG